MITDTKIPEESLIRALNTKIPDDMVILECSEVSLDFHARYHAKSKEYVYKILNSKFKDPFLQDLALRYTYSMDMGLIEKVAEKFVGQHDFAAFCSSGSQSVNTVRTIYDFDVTKNGDIVELTIKGNGFLYNMVRIIVGTILFVNEGKIAVEEIDDIIKNKDRRKAGRTAKACGLYLNKVEY
jgi:tRNA pseudouridine38-40 synthase